MAIDSGEVARTALKALAKAQRRHEEWSGWWCAPPEYVATVEVARAVHRCAEVVWVTPEYGISDTFKDAGRSTGRRPKLPRKGRFDIVVWTNKRPRGVIEVKTRGYSKLIADVDRVCKAIGGSRRIDWGLVAFICASSNRKKTTGEDWVRDRAIRFENEATQVVQEHGLSLVPHHGTMQQEENGAWVAGVLEIRLEPSSG